MIFFLLFFLQDLRVYFKGMLLMVSSMFTMPMSILIVDHNGFSPQAIKERETKEWNRYRRV